MTEECAYQCPYTREGHVAHDVDHPFTEPPERFPLRGWDMPVDGDGLSRWVVPGEEGQNASSSKKPK